MVGLICGLIISLATIAFLCLVWKNRKEKARAKLLQVELLQILSKLAGHLTEDDLHSIRELVKQGEWGIGFEILCEQLYEYDVRIPRVLYDRLDLLGRKIHIDESEWQFLRSLII